MGRYTKMKEREMIQQKIEKEEMIKRIKIKEKDKADSIIDRLVELYPELSSEIKCIRTIGRLQFIEPYLYKYKYEKMKVSKEDYKELLFILADSDLPNEERRYKMNLFIVRRATKNQIINSLSKNFHVKSVEELKTLISTDTYSKDKVNPFMDREIAKFVDKMVEANIDKDIILDCINPNFNDFHMREILSGYKNGLTKEQVSLYNDSNSIPLKMKMIKDALINNYPREVLEFLIYTDDYNIIETVSRCMQENINTKLIVRLIKDKIDTSTLVKIRVLSFRKILNDKHINKIIEFGCNSSEINSLYNTLLNSNI